MFSDLNVFKMAYAMATHAGTRQAVIAQNMANADTPGYRERDIAPFAETFARESAGIAMQASRTGHLNGTAASTTSWTPFETDGPGDPNRNNVSVEEQMLKAVEVKRQHDRALAIYKSSMNILRVGLGRG
ncbi:FlgB family protein [Ruegeria pomeroyi]|nr:FlgB family protein [Ruegeria pomeroyi]